jgi:hypothetical protein
MTHMNVSMVEVKSRDLVAKFWFAMRFFLKETKSLWMFRGTDDTVINFPELGSFLAEVETYRDPRTEFVFLANCVPLDSQTAYPQGGSGYLLSRKAVETLVPFEKNFIASMVLEEDRGLSRLKEFTGSFRDITSAAFCGHMFPHRQIAKLAAHNLWFPQCKKMRTRPDPCRYLVAPLNRLVFYHEYLGNFATTFDNAQLFFAADPSLNWWMSNDWPMICRMTPPVGIHVAISGRSREKDSGTRYAPMPRIPSHNIT